MMHINFALKKLGKTLNLQKEFLKTEMDHNELSADTWRDKKDKRLDPPGQSQVMYDKYWGYVLRCESQTHRQALTFIDAIQVPFIERESK